MFCTLLRWQLWAGRHHLPLFVLFSALIGLVIERFSSKRAATVVTGILIAYALALSLVNRTRSFIPWSKVDNVSHSRNVLYFNDQHAEVAETHIRAAEFVNGTECKNVAIDSYTEIPASEMFTSPKSFFVYPMMTMIHADGHERTIWYSGVQNLTSRYVEANQHPAPCAVICLDCARAPSKWQEYREVGGRASVFDYIVVFQAKGAMENNGEPPTSTENRETPPQLTQP